jgi:hypothetical protein
VNVVRGEVVLLDPAVTNSRADRWLLLDGRDELPRGDREFRFVESGRWLDLEVISRSDRILSKALGQSSALVENTKLGFGGLDDFIPIDISDAVVDNERHDGMCVSKEWFEWYSRNGKVGGKLVERGRRRRRRRRKVSHEVDNNALQQRRLEQARWLGGDRRTIRDGCKAMHTFGESE